MEGDTFVAELTELCAREILEARGDPDRQAQMVERLAHILGVIVAHAALGDGSAIDKLICAAEAHAHAAAVEMARSLHQHPP